MANQDARVPKRGEIWLVNLDPTIGAEIRKKRPAIVVSSDAIGKLPIKLVAPITEWQPAFGNSAWHVRIEPEAGNGLNKVSSIDTLQLRGIDIQRFITYFGKVPANVMEEVAAAVAVVVEYQ